MHKKSGLNFVTVPFILSVIGAMLVTALGAGDAIIWGTFIGIGLGTFAGLYRRYGMYGVEVSR